MALRLLTGAALLTLADAAATCVSFNGTDYTDTTLAVTVETADDALCTLSASQDFGVTPGSCADVGTTATCAHVAGTFTVDSCTSTLVASPNTETLTDTVACALTASTDSGTTIGSCADTDTAVATCAYVPGAITTADTCTSTTSASAVKGACTTSATVQWIGEDAQESAMKTSPRRKTWWTKRLTKGTKAVALVAEACAATDETDTTTDCTGFTAGTGSTCTGITGCSYTAPVTYVADSPKDWERIYTGGQPTERDLKMMYEQGFDGVYSLWPFPDPNAGSLKGAGSSNMPTGAQAAAAAAEAGLMYGVIPQTGTATCTETATTSDATDEAACGGVTALGDSISCNAVMTDADAAVAACTYTPTTAIGWTSTAAVDAVEKFMDFALANTDGPIYLHCYIGRTSTAALQFYRARKAAASSTPAIVAQTGKSITQTAIIESGYHGIDITSWAGIIAREAGETMAVAAADLVSEVVEVTEGCDPTDGTGETAGDTTCTLVGATGDASTCNAVAANCAVAGGTGTCAYRAAVAAVAEIAAATAVTGDVGEIPAGMSMQGIGQYHWLKPLGVLPNGVKMFDAGQINAEHVDDIAAAGIVSVVNMRKQGPIADVTATTDVDETDAHGYVEETNLLNVKSSAKTKQSTATAVAEACEATDETDTTTDCTGFTAGTETTCTDITGCSYTAPLAGVTSYRNDATWLADATAVTGGNQHVLDNDRADAWTALAGENFEVLNTHEFGTDVARGYDQREELAAFAATDSCTVVPGTCSEELAAATTCTLTTGAPGSCAKATGDGSCTYVAAIRYVNLPVGGSMNPGYDAAGLVQYSAELIDAINYATANSGNILFHCRTGYRTGAYPSALLKALGIQTGDEVVERLESIGYDESTIEGKGMKSIIDGVADTTWTGSVDATSGVITGALTMTSAAAAPVPDAVVKTSGAATTTVVATLVAAAVAFLA